MSEHHLTDKAFASLGLAQPLLQGVIDAGFQACTPIQALTLPVALAGRDVAGQAQTGTGKTAAFLLATFHHLLTHPAGAERRNDQPRAIILAPTRELAVQIHKDAETLGRHAGLRLGLVFGGTGYDSQRRMLEAGVDVLIGTPGRLIDYFKQHVFDLRQVQVVVLDEADRMFDLGFIKDIRFLLRHMPPATGRLGMLFSATLSYRVTELAYEHMNNPEFIRVEADKVTADRVKQVVYYPANEEKLPLLVGLLRQMDPHRSLVFTNTKGAAERVADWLQANGIRAEALTGDVPQPKRLQLLADFTEGRLPALVATDVAARGLHIPDVSHVFNYDLPQDPEDYVHRIGRTARAGATGDAISFACEEYAFALPEIESYIGHRLPAEGVAPELLPRLERPARRTHYAGHDHTRERRPHGERRDRDARRGGDGRHEPRRPPRSEAPVTPPAAEAPARSEVRPRSEVPAPAPAGPVREPGRAAPAETARPERAAQGRPRPRQPEKPAIG